MIEIKNLCYTYSSGNHESAAAVNNINLSINNCEILGIIGKTGSGKSTLAQMISGMIKPDFGEILLGGKNIWSDFKNNRELKFKVGIVFQYPEQQIFGTTVFNDIAFGIKNKDIPKNEIEKYVREAAEFAQLSPDLFPRLPLELSGGEKRRCAIAGVIAMNPEVLILDEPTSGLDQKGKKSIITSLLNYHKEKKNIIIFISHIMEEIAEIASKILVLDKGEPVLFDTPKNVFKHAEKLKSLGLGVPQSTEIISLINRQGYNITEGIINAQEAQIEILKLLRSKEDEI